jgi:hypothetical protein
MGNHQDLSGSFFHPSPSGLQRFRCGSELLGSVGPAFAAAQRRFSSTFSDQVFDEPTNPNLHLAKLQVEVEEMKGLIRPMEAKILRTPRLNASRLLDYCIENLPPRDQTTITDATRLSRLTKPFDTYRLEKEFRNCAAAVADSMGKWDQYYHPVAVVVGAPGQGKTEVLHWITVQYREAVDGPSIIKHEFAAKLKAMNTDGASMEVDHTPIKDISLAIPRLLVLRAFLLNPPPWADQGMVEDLLSVTVRAWTGYPTRDIVDIKPLFTGWQLSEAHPPCARKPRMEDLEAMDLVEETPCTMATGEALIKRGVRNGGAGVCFAFPKASDYPAIQGVVFGLLRDAKDATKQYPLAVQMSCFAGAGPTALVRRAQRAHEQMKQLGSSEGEYYVLLCGTNLPSTIPTDLPKGTLVVGDTFLEALCRPFGLGPAVLDAIRSTGSDETLDTLLEIEGNVG